MPGNYSTLLLVRFPAGEIQFEWLWFEMLLQKGMFILHCFLGPRSLGAEDSGASRELEEA